MLYRAHANKMLNHFAPIRKLLQVISILSLGQEDSSLVNRLVVLLDCFLEAQLWIKQCEYFSYLITKHGYISVLDSTVGFDLYGFLHALL